MAQGMTLDFSELQQFAKELRCVICFDLFQDPVVTPCNHCFCRECIEHHLRVSNSCPLCKAHVIKRALTGIPVVANLMKAYQRMVGLECLSQLSQRASQARRQQLADGSGALPPPSTLPASPLFRSPTSFSSDWNAASPVVTPLKGPFSSPAHGDSDIDEYGHEVSAASSASSAGHQRSTSSSGPSHSSSKLTLRRTSAKQKPQQCSDATLGQSTASSSSTNAIDDSVVAGSDDDDDEDDEEQERSHGNRQRSLLSQMEAMSQWPGRSQKSNKGQTQRSAAPPTHLRPRPIPKGKSTGKPPTHSVSDSTRATHSPDEDFLSTPCITTTHSKSSAKSASSRQPASTDRPKKRTRESTPVETKHPCNGTESEDVSEGDINADELCVLCPMDHRDPRAVQQFLALLNEKDPANVDRPVNADQLAATLGPIHGPFDISDIGKPGRKKQRKETKECYAHDKCLLWTPECYEKPRGCFHNVDKAVRRSRRLHCNICGQSGATLGCNVKGCSLGAHVACALLCGPEIGLLDHRNYLMYCGQHASAFR